MTTSCAAAACSSSGISEGLNADGSTSVEEESEEERFPSSRSSFWVEGEETSVDPSSERGIMGMPEYLYCAVLGRGTLEVSSVVAGRRPRIDPRSVSASEIKSGKSPGTCRLRVRGGAADVAGALVGSRTEGGREGENRTMRALGKKATLGI